MSRDLVAFNPFIPHTDSEIKEMLNVVGVSSIEELFSDIPREYLFQGKPDFEGPMCEREVSERIGEIASKNVSMSELQLHLGQGIYPRYVPAVVKEIVSRSEFLTSYTPYQPEVSQGILTALFEYQSLMADLLEMDVVNSSMYDWSTALGEAGRMAIRLTSKRRILVGRYISRERLETLRTYVEPMDGVVEEVSFTSNGELNLDELGSKINDSAAIYVENPTSLGFLVQNLGEVAEVAHRRNALFIMGFEPTSLAILKPPGEVGADIAVSDAQSLGLGMCFGGPSLGVLACRFEQKFVRCMPGRLIGMTSTTDGSQRCFTMVLQTREQHIKRERATSNICTNQTLLAVGAAAYLTLLGKKGLRSLAEYILGLTQLAINSLGRVNHVKIPFKDLPHYMEFAYTCENVSASEVLRRLLKRKIAGGVDVSGQFPELGEAIVACFTEVHGFDAVERYVKALEEVTSG